MRAERSAAAGAGSAERKAARLCANAAAASRHSAHAARCSAKAFASDGRDFAVVEAGQELGGARGMERFVHRSLPESSGVRMSFSWPRPRAMRDLTVPTGSEREIAISS